MTVSSDRSKFASSIANSFRKLLGKKRMNGNRRKAARRRLLEQLEPRQLMAINIVSLSPADDSIGWPLNTDLTITFDGPVTRGQGNINVVQQSTGVLGVAVDVRSAAVTISGNTVTVDLPNDLLANNAYHVLIDNGAFLDSSATPTANTVLLEQNFDLLPLSPFVTYTDPGIGDGTDYTLTPPLGYSIDNSANAAGGVPEFRGWSFMDKQSWINEAGQSRNSFTLGSGTVAIADPDEFDDLPNGRPFNSTLVTRPISLVGVAPNSAVIEFDSSFRPEDSQVGTLQVRFDGTGSWQDLITLNPQNTNNDPPSATNTNSNLNERLRSGTNSAASSGGFGNIPFRNVQNPAGATSMEFRWNVVGSNDWWWAFDNLKVTGTTTGVPFAGIANATTWNLDIPKLSIAIDKPSMSENGGTATGTVSRNGAASNWTAPLTVTLASNDTTEATVPASVVIPAGQASITFPIIAVDDTLSDRLQTVIVSADASSFAQGTRSINVLDDEGPKVVSLAPPDGATAVDYKSNFVVNLDTPVRKGSGVVNLVRSSDKVAVASLDIRSSAVTVVNTATTSSVTIDPPINLNGLTDYYILIDDGALIDLSSTPSPASILLKQDFDFVTTTAPTGFTSTDWLFLSKSAFVAAGGDAGFTRGEDIVAVTTAQGGFLVTSPIDLTGIAANSVVLEFDGSYSGGLPKLGSIQVSYNGGGSWTDLAQFDANTSNSHVVISSTGTTGATPLSPLNNPSSGTMLFRFGQQFNSGAYLAIDNIKITGEVTGVPFQGFSDSSQWNFKTAEAPTLTVTIDKTSMSENAGTATGTVTRNLSTTGAVTVTLTSSDTSEATIPATVTIPDGQASVTFPITGVDDLIVDGSQLVTVSAAATDFFAVPASITILDDDFPKVVSVSPADNATAVPVGANLVITFDQNVKKGNGFVNIIRSSDNKSVASIDIRSSAVSITGAVVTIDPPTDLAGLADYYVSFDGAAILSTAVATAPGTVLLNEDFELLTLQPAVFETGGVTATGRDFTTTPPAGFEVDNTLMPPGGVPEWTGWTFADKNFWMNQGGQNRDKFTFGTGTIAVGETDEWDDTATLNNNFNGALKTAPIDLTGVAANSVVLEFDSSFRPENSQVGTLEFTTNGTDWNSLLVLDPSNTSNSTTAANINERRIVNVPNPASGSLVFRYRVTGANDWWWAIDNLKVTGELGNAPAAGIAKTNTTTWNFSTAEAQTLTVTTSPTAIAENGATATGTVTRNLGTSGALVVNLTSADPTIATVPATVTIPDGQSSATFTITAVDDTVADGLKKVQISASTAGFVNGAATVSVTDNETPSVIISELMFNPAGAEPRTEWIEVYNRGAETADLGGWKFDDEDNTNWGTIPAGTLLPAGKSAVIYNNFFGTISEATFRTDWKVPTDAVVVGLKWGDLANSPAPGNEVLRLQDAGQADQRVVNFDDDGTNWPAAADGPSIYLKDVTLDSTVGTNWARSVLGTDNAVNPTGTIYAAADVGSPGVVPPTTLVAGPATQTVSGVSLRFSRVLDVTKLNLVDSNNVNGVSDLTLVGAVSGAVRGSVVLDADGRGFTFIKSGGPLVADTYTLTLRSAANGFVDAAGNLLDGNGDGTAGDDLVRTFTVTAIPETTVVLSVGDFVRGAGQTVNLPATSTSGIPITISTGVNVSGASFELRYNPTLLTITGGTTAIAGATVTVNTATAGVAIVTVTSSAQFSAAAGALTLVNLVATVPTTASIGPKSLLRLANVSVTAASGGALTSASDDGVQLSAYRGDVNNSNSITTGDVTGLLRATSGALSTTGFTSFKLADPVIVGDMNDSSSLTTGDTTGLLRFISGVGGGFPAIPALPTGLTPTLGADPQIFIPQDLTVTAGNSVTVPINVRVTEPAGVSIAGVDVTFTYDASRYTIGAVSLGNALTGFTFSNSNNVATPGFARLVYATDFGPAFSNGFVGTLLNVTLTAKADAAPGASAINLTAAGASDNDTNDLTIAPAITAGVDSSDGVITIPGASNGAPTGLALSPTTIAENAGANATVGTFTTTDPDAGNTFTYTLVTGTGSTDNAAFNISGGTLRATASFDFETKSSYNVRVRTTDQGGLFFENAFVIAVTNVNETPIFSPASYTFSVPENSAAGTLVGTVTATDPDAGTTLTYSLSGVDASKFVINPTTGAITVAAGTELNFEGTNSFSMSASVSDGSLSTTAAVTINVTNVNETPVFAPPSYTFALAENSASGTAVGTVSATDVEGSTLTYSLSGTGAGNFVINPSTGAITVAAGAVLNFEGTATWSLTATASDGSLSGTAPVTINLTNVNEAPVFNPASYTFSLSESATSGTAVGTTSATDVDAGTTLTYSLSGTGAGNFVINPSTGAITVAAGAVLNFEGTATWSLTATASDGSLSSTAPVTINLTNVNEAPVFNPANYTFSLSESATSGTAVGTTSATDVDAGTTLTYSLSGSTNFAINPSTGAITVAAGASFNAGTTPSYNLIVTASDGSLTATAPVTVNMTAAHVAASLTSVTVNGGDTFKNPSQRSEITSLVVTFSAPVTLSAGAFSIVNTGLESAQTPVALAQSQILITANAANTQFTIRFGAGPGVITRGTDGLGRGNSLVDGNYVLSIDPTKVFDGVANLNPVNALGDGDNEFGDLAADEFFRMFGDSNGDGVISTSDTAAFRASLTNYDSAFDWDGNGSIASTGDDRNNFLANFGKRRRR